MATVHESRTIAGVYHVQPAVHGDVRGLFVETFRREWIPGAREMIQANRAYRTADLGGKPIVDVWGILDSANVIR